MRHRTVMVSQVLAVLSSALIQEQANEQVIRIGRDAGKTDFVNVPSAYKSGFRQQYKPEPRLHGAAKQKRAANKARNKKRGR